MTAPPWWRRMFDSQQREARQMAVEFMQFKGVFPLLMKCRNGGTWTAEEKLVLLEHLRRLARLSPYLLLLLLPGSALLLPIFAWWMDRRRGERP